MAAAINDGGGGGTTPTTTTTSGSSTRTAKSGTSTPSTPTTTASTSLRPETRFNRRLAEDRDASPTLTDAVRRAESKASEPSPTKNRPSTPTSTKGRPSTPKAEKTLKRPKSDAPLSNNGRAQNLNSGGHTGSRDTKITELKASRAALRAEETVTEDRIKVLEAEIKNDEGMSSTVGTVVDVVTSPVTAVFGLFGKSNPIGDAAEGAAAHVLGLADDKKALKAKEASLAAQQVAIEREIKRLENEQVLNFLADTAHVTDMDDEVADFLEEGTTRIDEDLVVDLKIGDTGSGSDGVFDAQDGSITMSSGMLDENKALMRQLQREGIVDGDGKIVDEEAFDASAAGDQVIKTVSTIGVHEVGHAQQHANDTFAPAFQRKHDVAVEVLEGLLKELGDNPTKAQVDAAVQQALTAGETARTQMVEVSRYVAQERNDLKSGAIKKAFITVHENGTPLPEDQQLANVMAWQSADPLPFGPSAGYQRKGAALQVAGIAPAAEAGHDEHGSLSADALAAAGLRGPGLRGPGLRGPAWLADALAAAGNAADGLDADGLRGPAWLADALAAAALSADALIADGLRGPGLRGPGLRGPAWLADALAAAALSADALIADGLRGPGLRGPAWLADALAADAMSADALIASAMVADGLRGPGYTEHDDHGPGERTEHGHRSEGPYASPGDSAN